MNKKGFLKIKILDFQSSYFAKKNFIINISTHGGHSLDLNHQQFYQASREDYFYYPRTDSLEFKIYESKQNNQKQGYFNLSILKLYNFPHQKHKININCVWRTVKDNIILDGVSAILKVQVLYLQSIRGRIDFNVNRIILDQASKSQYLKQGICLDIKTDEVASQTNSHFSQNHEVSWDQTLTFILENLPEKFQISLKSKSKDKQNESQNIGNVTINPYQQKYFNSLIKENTLRNYNIIDEQLKLVGKLYIKTLFRLI